jgi:hypothetical protein
MLFGTSRGMWLGHADCFEDDFLNCESVSSYRGWRKRFSAAIARGS